MTAFSRLRFSAAALIVSTTAAFACPGEEFAACLSEEELTSMVTTYCLASADSVSGLGQVAADAGFELISETKSSMIYVLSYRDPSSRHQVTLSGVADDTVTCTISTGEALDEGLAGRLSAAIVEAGMPATDTSESWDGTLIYEHDGGDGVGPVGLSLPDPSFDATIDVNIDRAVAFE